MPSTARREAVTSKIDVDATADQHFSELRYQGQSYLSRALKQFLPALTRQRILVASIRYLEARTRQNSQISDASLSQSALTQVGGPIASGPLSSFQSLLSSLLDQEIPASALIDACAKCADGHYITVLTKCLFLLVQVGPIRDMKALSFDLCRSQTQREDESLFGKPNEDVENVDPQSNNDSRSVQVVRRTGQSFVDEFVSKLIESVAGTKSSRTRSDDVFVSSLAREAPLSESAAQNVLHLLVGRMRRVDIFELPAFTYQLLLFASAKGNAAAKSQVFIHIAEVFSEHEKKVRRSTAMSQSIMDEDEDAIMTSSTTLGELRGVQGTALLHIEYAVKQDPLLSAEVIKLAKAGVETPRHFLSAFGTGIILSLARATAVQTNVLEMLRDAMLRFDKERADRIQNLYMSRVSMNDEKLAAPRKSLLHIAECTGESGWDYVKECLLLLAFVLLDKPLPNPSDNQGSDIYLAELLIFKLFKAHSTMRETIMEQLMTRIALQEKSCSTAIAILKKLADRLPYFVLEHNRHIRDGIELLPTLPPWMASSLISAFEPLLVARQDLQDYFHLVVRKSLFHRDTATRAVAIGGFLSVLSIFSSSCRPRGRYNSNSQSQDVSKRGDMELNAMLEALQPMRRVFSYSGALKAFWYKSAVQYLQAIESEEHAKAVAAAMEDILRPQLLRYVDPAKPPYLLIDHCVNEAAGGILVEPLGDLIWCLAVVELIRDPMSYTESSIIELARKLSSVSLQDFPVAKETLAVPRDSRNETDFEEGGQADAAAARASRNKVRVLGSVTEALLNSILIVPEEKQEWVLFSEIQIPLLLLKGKIFELLRNAGAASPADAFIDLGGDPSIEKIRPGVRLMLQRGSKCPGGGKKPGASKKGKSSEGGPSSGSAVLHAGHHRFGLFDVLSSASTKPNVPLDACMRLLGNMTLAPGQSQMDGANIFKGHRDSSEVQDLRVYLLAVAHKHFEDYVYSCSKRTHSNTEREHDKASLMNSCKALVRIAMNDFKRFRRATPAVVGKGGIKALQICESCVSAMPHLANSDKATIASFCKSLAPISSAFEGRNEEAVFDTVVEAVEKLVDTLIDDAMMKEVVVVLHIHGMLVETIVPTLDDIDAKSTFLHKRVQWATDAISERQIGDSDIVKALVQRCLPYIENNNDLRRAGEVCDRLLEVIGDCDEATDPPETDGKTGVKLGHAVAIQQDTCLATVDAVLDIIERALADVEWCLRRMCSLEASANSQLSDDADGKGGRKEGDDADAKLQEMTAKQSIRAEDAAQLRLEGVVKTLRGLARCAIAKWAQQEKLLKLVTRTYKALCSATQAQAKRRGDPRTSFTSLINECKELAPTLWTYLAFIGADTTKDGQGKGTSRAAKEARVMPPLVYEVERFEKVLIGAQKRTKINLLRGMRRNIARDFRIREDLLHNEEDDADGNGEEDGPENDGRSRALHNSISKRRRLS